MNIRSDNTSQVRQKKTSRFVSLPLLLSCGFAVLALIGFAWPNLVDRLFCDVVDTYIKYTW